MNREELTALIKKKQSFLCVGLDSDPEKIPHHLQKYDDPVFEFNKNIIDATLSSAVAYKPNLAFYEAQGSKGLQSLEKTMTYINSLDQPLFTIADAKRGDIGNSAAYYARAFFETMNFDAVTVSPYMGYDSIEPFFKYPNKWTIILAITSNPGAKDFQLAEINLTHEHPERPSSKCITQKLYERVIEKTLQQASPEQVMFVAGATQPEIIHNIREIAPDSFLLVPGVGAQGGSLEAVAGSGMVNDCGLLVNASRSVIFASGGEDYAQAAAREAKNLQKQMQDILLRKGVIEE